MASNTAQSIIPTDQDSIFDLVSALSQLDQQAIVRPNNPPLGVAGFLFDIPDENEINLRSDITDHYIEDNTAIQDQIGLKPEEYTVRGLVAELVAYAPTSALVAKIPDALPTNAAFLPDLTAGAFQALAQAAAQQLAIVDSVTSSQDLYSLYSQRAIQPPNATHQSSAFGYFYELWKGRQLVTVETPWGIFTNMAIMSVGTKQDGTTKYESAFTVTFKKIRVAQSVTVSVGLLAGRAIQQQAPTSQNGTAGKTPLTPAQQGSILFRMTQKP